MANRRVVVMVITLLLSSHAQDTIRGDEPKEELQQELQQQQEVQNGDCPELRDRMNSLEDSVRELRDVFVSTRFMVRPGDCGEVYHQGISENGVHEIQPNRFQPTLFNVSCIFDEDGLWTVIQRRVDDSTDFNRSWAEYRDGFGTAGINDNQWLGLEHVYQMTSQRQYTVRFDVRDWKSQWYHADYAGFRLDDERHHYTLHYSDILKRSTAGDGLHTAGGRLSQNGMAFSTPEADHDGAQTQNCASMMGGGWWYNWCGLAYLNGKYHVKNQRFTNRGIRWGSLKHAYSFSQTRIRIKATGLYPQC